MSPTPPTTPISRSRTRGGRPDVHGQRHQRDERQRAHARYWSARCPHRVPLSRRGRSAAGDGPDPLSQRRREQALPVLRPVLNGVLPAAPKGDHQRGVIVHRPGEAMTVPVADVPGPAAPPPPVEPDRKPKSATRKPMSLWVRTRLLLLFVLAWFIIVWASMADNPLLPFSDAALIQLHDSQWLIWLSGL